MPISFVSEDEALAFRLYRGRWHNPRDREHQIIRTIPMSFLRTPSSGIVSSLGVYVNHIYPSNAPLTMRDHHTATITVYSDSVPLHCRARTSGILVYRSLRFAFEQTDIRVHTEPSQPSYPRVITQTRGFVTAKDRFYEYRAAARETRSCYAGIPENRAISLYLFATLFQRNDPRYTHSFLDAFHALDTTRKCMWRCHARWALKNSSRTEY